MFPIIGCASPNFFWIAWIISYRRTKNWKCFRKKDRVPTRSSTSHDFGYPKRTQKFNKSHIACMTNRPIRNRFDSIHDATILLNWNCDSDYGIAIMHNFVIFSLIFVCCCRGRDGMETIAKIYFCLFRFIWFCSVIFMPARKNICSEYQMICVTLLEEFQF